MEKNAQKYGVRVL
jgi:hypothetical protein